MLGLMPAKFVDLGHFDTPLLILTNCKSKCSVYCQQNFVDLGHFDTPLLILTLFPLGLVISAMTMTDMISGLIIGRVVDIYTNTR